MPPNVKAPRRGSRSLSRRGQESPPSRRFLTQAEAFKLLGRQVLYDAILCGWIRPCAVKQGKGGPATKLYREDDVRSVEYRILSGQYPQPPHPAA